MLLAGGVPASDEGNPDACWGTWCGAWRCLGAERGGQDGIAPSPARCMPSPAAALTFSCPAGAAGPVGATAVLGTAFRQRELEVLTWEHQKPLIWYPNDE